MRIPVRSTALMLVAALLLVGCGSDVDDGSPTAVDPTAPPTRSQSAEPTVGSYPSYAPQDYTYTLHVSCFCMGAQAGIRVTVENGEVTDAVYADDDRGVEAGAEVDDYRRLTINDVIDAANNTHAARVDVTWPAGQDYPSKVYVDPSERIADEEVGYSVSDVSVR